MSWYYLTPTNKWGIIEIMNFRNEDKGILLKININWKRGSFYVHNLDEKEIPSSPNTIELESLFDEVSVASVENGAEEFLFYDAETKELIEDQDQFQEVIEECWEEGVNYLYDNGYEEEDPEFWIESGYSVEKTDPPYEDYM